MQIALGWHWSQVGATRDTFKAEKPCAKEFSEPNSPVATLALGCLGQLLLGCCPFSIPDAPGNMVTKTPRGLPPAPQGVGGAPHPLGTKEGPGGGER